MGSGRPRCSSLDSRKDRGFARHPEFYCLGALMTPEQLSASSLVAAVMWVRGVLLGTVATTVAVICIAGVGYQFLSGRIPSRRAVTVVLGSFILFGAPSIAVALSALTKSEPTGDAVEQDAIPPPQASPKYRSPSRAAPDPFDPYGG